MANERAAVVVDRARAAGVTLGVAESLTGGALVSALVSVPGASQIVAGAVVAYQSRVKVEVLGVSQAVLARHGSTSSEVALAMARGARSVLGADVAIATTGVAGPGEHEGRAAGFVCIAVVGGATQTVRQFAFEGGRDAVRAQAADAGLELLSETLAEM